MKLQDATVLITGGSSGIGLELARQLAARGNTVIITGRRLSALQAAKAETPGLHIRVCDVSDAGAVAELRVWLETSFPDLNVLINSAGVMRKIDLQAERSLDDLTREIDTNLKGLMWMVAALLPQLKRQEKAAIINLSSGLAYVPMAISPIYSTTKAGIHAYTRALRAQLTLTAVEVFEVAPPGTDTPMFHGDFTPEDLRGPTPMSAPDVAAQAIRGIERGAPEIRIGLAKTMQLLSRLAPALAFRLVSRSAALRMAQAHVN